MVMTSRPARVRPLRSRASTVSFTNGSVQDKHDRRETCVGAAAVGQRRLRGLEEEGMGTAQQRAMQADALIHGFAQMAPLMRCEGHLPYRGKQLSIICIPFRRAFNDRGSIPPTNFNRANVFSSSKRNFDFPGGVCQMNTWRHQ